METLSPHCVSAVGKLLTLNNLGGDRPSYTFILKIVERLRMCQFALKTKIIIMTMLIKIQTQVVVNLNEVRTFI